MVSTKHQKPVLTVEPLGNSVNRRAKNLPARAFRAPDPEEKISESKTAESHKPETSLVTILSPKFYSNQCETGRFKTGFPPKDAHTPGPGKVRVRSTDPSLTRIQESSASSKSWSQNFLSQVRSLMLTYRPNTAGEMAHGERLGLEGMEVPVKTQR
ncbi:hypothetical protein RRG08_020732 [Elysia crispata]|uniref:Uncharacterized protein n=1 Tax=Elysia crispata TaxID=231223 RepID=A0AAE1ASR2_9GAST|nr:hypothetical protein RRG08_020732 [Elysia crispata]